jgi:hypothetical protein
MRAVEFKASLAFGKDIIPTTCDAFATDHDAFGIKHSAAVTTHDAFKPEHCDAMAKRVDGTTEPDAF